MPNPPESVGLSTQHYWMQIVIRNATQFYVRHTGSMIFSGRYWPTALPPPDIPPFTVNQFAACNLEQSVGSGTAGGTSFKVDLENTGHAGGQQVDFSIVRIVAATASSKTITHASSAGLGGSSHWSG